MATIKMIEKWIDDNTGDLFSVDPVSSATRDDGRTGITINSNSLFINGIVDSLDGEVEIVGISCYEFVERYAHKMVNDLELGVVRIVYLHDLAGITELVRSTYR